jgi:hypothetical protein
VTKIDDLHRRWRKDADYKGAYDDLGEEFDLARSLIDPRTTVRPSQPQHAKNLTTPRHASRESTGKPASMD